MIAAVRRAVSEAAEQSQGVLARSEIVRLGVSPSSLRRRMAIGEWATLLPGAIRVARGDSEWHQLVAAACIWGGPEAWASHRTAAALWRLDGFSRDIVEITTTRHKDPKELGLVVHRTRKIERAEVAVVDRIPVTSPTRTLIDLGAVSGRQRVELALDDALRRGLTSLARVEWFARVHSKRGRRGVATIKSLLIEKRRRRRITESGFETRLFQLLRSSRLPVPVPQFVIEDDGRFVARVDFAYPEVRLAIEAVSYKWHSASEDWSRDQIRSNKLIAVGWRVLNVTWEEMRKRPAEVIAQIRAARGDEGVLFR